MWPASMFTSGSKGRVVKEPRQSQFHEEATSGCSAGRLGMDIRPVLSGRVQANFSIKTAPLPFGREGQRGPRAEFCLRF